MRNRWMEAFETLDAQARITTRSILASLFVAPSSIRAPLRLEKNPQAGPFIHNQLKRNPVRNRTIKRVALFPAMPMLVSALICNGHVQAKESVTVLSYPEVIAAYQAKPKVAADKYTGKRLAFRGQISRMGHDPEGTFYAAVTEDGSRLTTFFEVSDQAPLASKFKNQKIVGFESSDTLVFECRNGGLMEGTILPTLHLTNCRLIK